MRTGNTKRDKLLAAIDMLFLQKGLDAVTISDVAFLAGVPTGNVYYYFKTKTSMLQEALKVRLSQLRDSLIDIERRTKSPKIHLQDFINLFLGFPKRNLPDEITTLDENNIGIKDFVEEPPSLGKFITTMLLDLEKNKNKEIYDGFSPIITYVLGWCASKFLELGGPISGAESTAIKFINMLSGACSFSLNTNVKTSTNDSILQYINFIIQTFGLEDSERSTVIPLSDWKK